jgi:hypothetical protein
MLLTTDDLNRFIEQLPHALAAPAHLDLAPGDESGLWHITLTLAPSDQAALDALRPSVYQLCAAAQHALGLATLGSQIELARTMVRVRVGGELLLGFTGEGALWWVANVPPTVLWATIDHLLVQITQRNAAP